MIISLRRIGLLVVVATPFVLIPSLGQAAQESPRPAAGPTISSIQLSFRRDPRLVDPTRNPQQWVPGPRYAGATAQDTVEVRVEGVNAAGKPAKISPQWIPSDPEMVTVSPTEGDDVKITVHRAGESKLKIAYQGLSKELAIKAKYVNKFMMLEMEEVTAPKPKPPAATAEARPAGKTKSDISYAAGMNLAKALQEQSVDVDVDSVVQGIKDTFSGSKTRMTEQEALDTLAGLQTDQRMVEAGLTRKAVAEKNKREGEAFLAANKSKEGVVSLPSGLQYKVLKAGEGKKPAADDIVTVQYRGSFLNGQEFDSSYKRKSSVSFPVKSVIKGWQEALQLMPAGSKWELFVPPDLAYGERGAGGGRGRKRAGGPQPQIIGPNTTLVFDVELVAIGEPAASSPASTSTVEKSVPPELLETIKKALEKERKPDSKPEKMEIDQ
jgi:FKBP-type peptidyl-prolyl cis-trans isomerase FklB